jgi:sugar lactone lactonase YvrE
MKLRRIAAGVLIALALVGAYLCFWPVPAQPVAWAAPEPPGFTGAYAANTRLASLNAIPLASEYGPEHIAIGPDGKLYAAMTSGNVLRMDPDGAAQQLFATTGGRVLGFDFLANGQMVAADAMRGLLSIAPDGAVQVLTGVSAQDPVRYANSVVVAPDQTVYFTDASTRFSPSDWGGTYEASVLDILEQSASGRVLAYEPATGRTRVVAHGFSFANGIAISADGQSLFIAETGRYRIWKIDSHASDLDVRSGSTQARVLLDNLPGYPDNLMRGREGRIWVGLFRPRNPAADGLSQKPFLRKLLLRLPRAWLPLGQPYGHVFAMDENGQVVEDLQDPSGAYPETTGATETQDRLYIHSLHAPVLGWVPRSTSREEIYVLHSIRERVAAGSDWCSAVRTGFAPLASDAERQFSFWSVQSEPGSGRVTNVSDRRVAELRGCFGPTSERTRQNFYAQVRLGSVELQGAGECVALLADVPEAGFYGVRCHLLFRDLPAPYAAGLLTTNTLTSPVAFGSETNPPGYTQASIATLRLWRRNPSSPSGESP